MTLPYSVEELMVSRIASEVSEDGVTVLGSFTPLAYASYMLARLTHSPEACIVGFNAIGIQPLTLGITGVEGAAYSGALAHWTFNALTSEIHMGNRGLVECVSPAQVDGSGAFNLSVIGDYRHPKVRLPGGAGAPEVVQNFARLLMYVGRHDRRTLVEQVDFATGRRDPISDSERAERGLLVGPIRLLTPLCVLVKRDDGPFELESLHPGAEVTSVVDQAGFEIVVPESVSVTATPSEEQLQLLREVIDPHRTIRFDFLSASERREAVRAILEEERQAALSLSKRSLAVTLSRRAAEKPTSGDG